MENVRARVSRAGLCNKFFSMALVLAFGFLTLECAEKGDGKGTRKSRPSFKDSGSIFDDGKDNIDPKPPAGEPDNDEEQVMDPEAAATLAACFKVDVSEVAFVVGWDIATEARVAATALCAKLDEVKYGLGVNVTGPEVAVSF